jgi:hypothetical protein
MDQKPCPPPKPNFDHPNPFCGRYAMHYGALAGFLFWGVVLGLALSRIPFLSLLGKFIVWPLPMFGLFFIWGDNTPPAVEFLYNPFINGAVSLCLYALLGAAIGALNTMDPADEEWRSKWR